MLLLDMNEMFLHFCNLKKKFHLIMFIFWSCSRYLSALLLIHHDAYLEYFAIILLGGISKKKKIHLLEFCIDIFSIN